jgi:hypothetical protein
MAEERLQKVAVHAEQIEIYGAHVTSGTAIHFVSGMEIWVQETPEEIEKLIKQETMISERGQGYNRGKGQHLSEMK